MTNRQHHQEQEGAVPESEGDGIVEPHAEVDEVQAELEEANRKTQEYLNLLQRVQADFANYRRRIDQERAEQANNVKAGVILKFLPVLDDFERALENVPPEERQTEWVQGIALIRRKLLNILESEGVSRMEALGKQFNPWEHEAVLHQESDQHEEGEVTAVFRDGYKLNDKVIRPAQVAVAKSP